MDVVISKKDLDPEWDRFLTTMPDGCYQQSSMWAKAKASVGWKSLRLMVKESGQIIGGVQILLRSLPLFGAVGYVSKGPVIACGGAEVQKFILDQLDRIAQKEHILFLKMQPPQGAEDLAEQLVKRGARPSIISVTSLATFRVDLRPGPGEIQARMKKGARQGIRRAERRGVTFRVGTEADIPTFCRLEASHAQRRGYSAAAENYYRGLWSALSPGGHFQLFFADYEGQPLVGTTYISFGDVILAYHLGDSGLHRSLNAPSFLHWKAMLWGKEHGYTWFDFGGVRGDYAEALERGESLPDTKPARIAWFKHSFGSQLVYRPGVYDVSYIWPRALTAGIIPFLPRLQPLLSFLIGGSLTRYVRGRNRSAGWVAEHFEESHNEEEP
jgi:lipid II:glycine glycyltransferase (peptidoglycan interpeptide bridge formation enzyme)